MCVCLVCKSKLRYTGVNIDIYVNVYMNDKCVRRNDRSETSIFELFVRK